MSLLNDMLRDLSQDISRRTTAASETDGNVGATESQRHLFSQSSVARAAPRNLLPSVVVFALVLAVILGWRYFYPGPVAQEDVSTTIIAGSTEKEFDRLTDQLEEQKITVGNKDTVEQEAAAQLTERLASLESAITNLAIVVASNQTVNPQPFDTAEESMAINEPDYSSSAIAGESTVAGESVSIREPFTPESQISDSGDEETNQRSAGETADPSFFIAPNPAWQDEQTFAQARAEFNAGRTDQGLARLQTFIANHPAAPRSTALLLDIYCEQENSLAAEQLLSRVNYLTPEIKTYYSAKIALLNNKPEEAMALLEGSLVHAEQDENYRALLAGLYQRSGMNEEAASHYRRLLTSFGEKPAYWLGFALAQDALNQTQQALQAYQRVNQYSDLQPPVRQYVEQRLAALEH